MKPLVATIQRLSGLWLRYFWSLWIIPPVQRIGSSNTFRTSNI
jgi:hypothetical protein